MKRIFILILIITSTGYLFAQDKEEIDNIETFFEKPSKIRGYVGPLTDITMVDSEIAYMTGVNVAGIFNDHFILGFYNLNIENDIKSDNTNYFESTIDFNHKGIWLGYIFIPKRIIHFNTNVMLGKGDLELYDDFLNEWIEDDFIFVLTPSLEAEFNVAKFLRVGIGANYRFTFDVDKFVDYNDNDFSDFGAFVSFKFGWFN